MVGILFLGAATYFSAGMLTEKNAQGSKSTVAASKDDRESNQESWYGPIIDSVKGMFSRGEDPADIMTKAAVKGRFRITVNEKGFLDSQHNETLICKVPGSTTIIKIVPEGIRVKKGDIVCELDSSAYEDKARQQEIDVTQAEANLLIAQKNLEIQKTQNESDIELAKLKYKLAELDLEKYKEGELPQQRDKINGQIQLKKEQLARKKESYDFTRRMTKKGYKSQSDLEAERIAVTQAEIDLQVELVNLRVLEDYTAKRKNAQLEADAKEFKRELDRVILKAKAAMSKATAEVEARKLTLAVEKVKLQEWNERIANCILRAPQDGEIVYAKSSASRRGSSEPEIIEGATVRERQKIINIPDVTSMKIDAKIHESMISLVRVGQPVTIHADAQPDKVFHGVVAEISSVPLSGSWPNFDIKEYQVAINLTDSKEHVSLLRPGLSAYFEIIVQDREDVLQVPMQSVVQVGRDFYCWVLKGKKLERRKVKVGESNDTEIEILDGIEEGELTVMNPRTKFADEISELEKRFVEIAQKSPLAKPAGQKLNPGQKRMPPAGEAKGKLKPGQRPARKPGGPGRGTRGKGQRQKPVR